MKKQFGTNRFALGVLAIICALAFASTASAKNPKEVTMKIHKNENGKTELVIETGKHENDCPPGQVSEAGCIKVKRNEKSEIYFHLIGNTKCHLDSGTDWELSAIYLGGYNSDSKPKPGKFGFGDIADTDYDKVNADFNIAIRQSGLVTQHSTSTAKRLVINDENQHEYVVWYKIEAKCERTDGRPAHVRTTDPRVRNSGTD